MRVLLFGHSPDEWAGRQRPLDFVGVTSLFGTLVLWVLSGVFARQPCGQGTSESPKICAVIMGLPRNYVTVRFDLPVGVPADGVAGLSKTGSGKADKEGTEPVSAAISIPLRAALVRVSEKGAMSRR